MFPDFVAYAYDMHNRWLIKWSSKHAMQNILLTGVQAEGTRGALQTPLPAKFWATQIFWAASENLGKANF